MADKILAVIPCLNEEKFLEKLVRGLVISSLDLPLRIVIADGGSTDKTAEIAQQMAAQFSNVVYVHNVKRIQSAAINLAVSTYGDDAEYLIRIDAHAGYPSDYCQTLVEEAEKTKAASVVVAMDTRGKGGFQDAVAAAQNSKLGNGGSAHRNADGEGRWVDHGHHALMRIDAFRAVGGYDESFSHNEDAELDIRLRRAGFSIWLTGKTSLVYYPRSAPLPLFRQYMQYGYGRARTILKHRALPKLRQLAPAAIVPAALLALFTPIMPVAALPLAMWAALCLGYGVMLGIDAKNNDIMMAGPAAMIMHLGWSIGFWKSIFEELKRRANGH